MLDQSAVSSPQFALNEEQAAIRDMETCQARALVPVAPRDAARRDEILCRSLQGNIQSF
jgi:hypothetical protein